MEPHHESGKAMRVHASDGRDEGSEQDHNQHQPSHAQRWPVRAHGGWLVRDHECLLWPTVERRYSNLPKGIQIAMKQPHTHTSHPAIIKRLRRASGHLNSTIEMVVEGRECLDVAQQLQAVEKAIQQAKKALIQDHLDHCLEDMVGPLSADQRHSLDEFKEITRYL